MRVCILSTVHPTFDTRIFHREAISLAEAGFDVRLVIQYDGTEDVVSGVRIIPLPAPKRRWDRIRSGWQAVRLALAQHADIYHFHDPELIPWGIVLRLLTGNPVVYDVHEHYPDAIAVKQWIPSSLRRPVAWAFDLGERTAARFFDAVIVADETTGERFRRGPRPVVVLYNFPDGKTFCLGNGGILPWTRDHEVQMVYLGAISHTRGLGLMLDMVRLLVTDHGLDVGLWLAGRFGYAHEQQAFEERLEGDDELKARVRWLGIIPYDKVAGLLSAADIGLVPLQPIPKFRKNIPTKQFEYMAAGLPIVGSDLPPIRHFVEATQAGELAVADDARSHAAKIAHLVKHPDKARAMGDNGRHAFQSRYNWESEAQKLIRLYASLLE